MTPEQRQKFDLTIAQFVTAMQVRAWSPRTIDGYSRDIRSFIAWLADETDITSLGEITPETIGSYQAALLAVRKRDGQPLSMQTQALRLHALKSFFRWLTLMGELPTSPAMALRLPKRHRPQSEPLITARQAIALLESIDPSTPLGLRDRAILEIFYSTGIRNSELRHLEIRDFDPHGRILMVRGGKGGKDRVVPVGTVACEMLLRYIGWARPLLLSDPEETFLFVSCRGRRLGRDGVALIVARRVTKAGITRPVRPHRLRHACATHMLQCGADIRDIQMLLGHASLRSTQHYTKVEFGDVKAAHRRFHPRGRQR